MHLRQSSRGDPGKLSGQDRGGDEDVQPRWAVHSPSTQPPGLLRPGTGTKGTAHPGLCACRVPENLSGSDLGSTRNTGPTRDSALSEHLESKQCRAGKHALPWAVTNPVWSVHCKCSPHMLAVLVCSLPLSPQHS